MANTSFPAEQRQLVQLSLDSYHFPVESMVVRPSDGEVLNHINANNLLDISANAGLIQSFL